MECTEHYPIIFSLILIKSFIKILAQTYVNDPFYNSNQIARHLMACTVTRWACKKPTEIILLCAVLYIKNVFIKKHLRQVGRRLKY